MTGAMVLPREVRQRHICSLLPQGWRANRVVEETSTAGSDECSGPGRSRTLG